MTAADGLFVIVAVGGAGVCLLGVCAIVVDFMKLDLGVHSGDDGESAQ